VATPVRRDVEGDADFNGTTRPIEATEVRARVSGVLESIEFTPSTLVSRGDLLFVIEREQYRAARDQAAAALRSAQARLALAESDLERVTTAARTDAVSEQDVDRAAAQRDEAEAAVLSARARLDRVELDLAYTLVRSPIDGQVSRNLVDVGNLVGVGEPTLLTTVNRMDPIFVYFDVPESLVLGVLKLMSEDRRAALAERGTESEQPPPLDESGLEEVQKEAEVRREGEARQEPEGPRVLVGQSDGAGFSHEGLVDYIDNTIDPTTGTLQTRAVVPNPDHLLFPGIFVRARLLTGTIPNALLVEERAIGSDIGGNYVYVIGEENVVEQRYIEVGRKQEDGTVTGRDGLQGDETYIVDGLLRARPGLPVTPMTREQLEAERAARAAEETGGEE
jgi:RND family efflux transporter MFP subunit